MQRSHGSTRRRFVAQMSGIAALALATVSGLSTTAAPARADDWPSGPVTIVVPFDAGGSADRMARTLAEPLGEKLGQPVVVENRPGGAGGLGATYVSQQEADGNTLLLMQATPYLANAILVGGAPVSWEDFELLNAQWNDYAIVAVNKASPYQTFDDLVTAMKKPGEVSSGIIYGNGGHLQTLMMMDALKIPQDNVRFVTYSGGAPLRTALAGDQVDFEILAAEGARGISDKLRVLAIVNDEQPEGTDEPLFNDVMSKLGTDKQPIIGGNVTGLLVPSAFVTDYPDRYKKLLDAYKAVVEDPDYKASAKKAGVGADWVGPEKSQAMVDDAYKALSSYADVVKQ
ncbi:tripartite tricarboxylate transporter substrate binding protein [Jiella endophytica]|uniref:Tripartite tricarboxylate transporter substrate binding protein n=1 Tax=Jiella endophytica TaxID=2558362 RepID=A0A4Y8RGJ0_9HYPH|nr:tripartite tricarboxylate transporter substrate binding protein [Jiella endophytica]TFF21873.1 tripartite tricarboxylate transporter substrate binding protein [Jiella endophytica]